MCQLSSKVRIPSANQQNPSQASAASATVSANAAIPTLFFNHRQIVYEGGTLGCTQDMSAVAVRLRIAQRGEDMIETVKALPGLIKDWMSNSDLIYQLSDASLGC